MADELDRLPEAIGPQPARAARSSARTSSPRCAVKAVFVVLAPLGLVTLVHGRRRRHGHVAARHAQRAAAAAAPHTKPSLKRPPSDIHTLWASLPRGRGRRVPDRVRRRPRRDGRRLPRARARTRPRRRAEGDRARAGRGPGRARAVPARGAGGGVDRASERDPGPRRGRARRRSPTWRCGSSTGDDARTLVRRDGALSPGARRGHGRAGRRPGWTRSTAPATCTATSSPPTCSSTSDGHVYVTDFGLAKQMLSRGGATRDRAQWVGTLDYVAPEQIRGGADRRARRRLRARRRALLPAHRAGAVRARGRRGEAVGAALGPAAGAVAACGPGCRASSTASSRARWPRARTSATRRRATSGAPRGRRPRASRRRSPSGWSRAAPRRRAARRSSRARRRGVDGHRARGRASRRRRRAPRRRWPPRSSLAVRSSPAVASPSIAAHRRRAGRPDPTPTHRGRCRRSPDVGHRPNGIAVAGGDRVGDERRPAEVERIDAATGAQARAAARVGLRRVEHRQPTGRTSGSRVKRTRRDRPHRRAQRPRHGAAAPRRRRRRASPSGFGSLWVATSAGRRRGSSCATTAPAMSSTAGRCRTAIAGLATGAGSVWIAERDGRACCASTRGRGASKSGRRSAARLDAVRRRRLPVGDARRGGQRRAHRPAPSATARHDRGRPQPAQTVVAGGRAVRRRATPITPFGRLDPRTAQPVGRAARGRRTTRSRSPPTTAALWVTGTGENTVTRIAYR